MTERDELIDRWRTELTRHFADTGRLIEAGWLTLKTLTIPDDMLADQVAELRMAFFAGAQHLFGSIMTFLEPGDEETEDDLRRMDQISEELSAFAQELQARFDARGAA